MIRKDRQGNLVDDGAALIEIERQKFYARFYDNWVEKMLKSVEYKKPKLLGGKEILQLIEQYVDIRTHLIYSGFYMIKPGRCLYVVRFKGQAYLSKELIKCRSEEIPHCKLKHFC